MYHTPDRRPPRITGRFVNTVTRGWVGAPDERAPLRFHVAVVGIVDRYLSSTRNLSASTKDLAELFSSRSWPNIYLRIFVRFFCGHSERYRNVVAGVFEIPNVSIVIGLAHPKKERRQSEKKNTKKKQGRGGSNPLIYCCKSVYYYHCCCGTYGIRPY